jgi:hypothetical protein
MENKTPRPTNLHPDLEKLVERDIVNLDHKNGWGEQVYVFYTWLRLLAITKEKETKLGNCYYRYDFEVEVDGKKKTVTYKVDSSD